MEWEKFRQNKQAYPEAAERGRLLAASLISESLETRKRMEARFGIEFCMKMYPECYKSGFGNLLDKIRRWIPF